MKNGNVQPYKKSEPIPEVNNEPVKVVVADTLQDMVFNSGKNGIIYSSCPIEMFLHFEIAAC